MSRIRTVVFLLIFACSVFKINTDVYAKSEDAFVARPSTSGQLKVTAANLRDSSDRKVILRGVSLHGVTWFEDFVDDDLFTQVSGQWQANLIRIPVYTAEYINDRNKCLEIVRHGINAAINADMYVIVDWHILDDSDPNTNASYAKDFFETISKEHPGCPNILYEICNEPNGETTWSQIRDYAYATIPVIRTNSPDAVILIGTPNYCKNLISAARNSIKFDNIMYTLHFYAATHKDDLRREYTSAREMGLPIFVSECGISESSGTGDLDFDSAASWFSLLEQYNTSYAIWSLSNKNESSALFMPSYNPAKPFTDADVSRAGQWVCKLLTGEDPRNIEIPSDGEGLSRLHLLLLKILQTEDTTVAVSWPRLALATALFIMCCTIIIALLARTRRHRYNIYDDLFMPEELDLSTDRRKLMIQKTVIIFSVFFTLMYMIWRIRFSIPERSGVLAAGGNLLLLAVEILGFFESLVLYQNLMGLRRHPVPVIEEDEYPDVDIFIATYNEPCDLLRKTINGCVHLKYPDRNKVHIWLCDDNRRSEMRLLAEKMHVGYFDRPDNKGAKAGNLNHALSLTSSPYVVTLDADMIPRSCFLMNTIPYFVDAKKRSEKLPDSKKIRLGLVQTPQCFYTPDVFQHALYSEKSAPNEQDFFYRTIEVAKTSTNSVIYGGSNTVIAREALDAIGGFFTGSITEDFATGMLIESAGFVSLATGEPLASGMTPGTYKEHIQQRKRWGRGVISTGKQLHLLRRKGLSLSQKLSYFSSVIYWYSPLKNLIYIISPLFFACFAIPMFKCGWLDLLIYWLPMFIMQDVALRVFSGNAVSLKWSGIYETGVMPHLLIPVIKETFGISASVFEVTDKSKKIAKRKMDIRGMMPFLILIALSIYGIIRSVYLIGALKAMGIVVLLFWLIRNTYFLIMSVFLIDGRDGGSDDVTVIDAEPVTLTMDGDPEGRVFAGITTYMTSHDMKVFMDEREGFKIGDRTCVTVSSEEADVKLQCFTTSITNSRHTDSCVLGLEIMNLSEVGDEYNELLYDRIPTLPQSLTRDYGIIRHLLRNIAYRILR
ncbi:MAG: cellulase family glycosylhydrolase [Lachnospiraceae bacterium]|nr:cellulase family glycosylhydrolase [Lachnospiraceae bacterium]